MIKKNYIPTINISSILRKNFNSKTSLKIVKEIEKACLDVGFFQIIYNLLPLQKLYMNIQTETPQTAKLYYML